MFGLFLAVLSLGLLAQKSGGQAVVYEHYDPSSTSVAILPVINRSGEKVEEQRIKQSRFGSEELVKRFSERGFSLVGSQVINDVLRDKKIDLDDEENYRKALLFDVGKTVKAKLLIFMVIDYVDQRDVQKLLVRSKVAKAQVRIWFLDVESEKPLLNAARMEASSEGGGMFPDFEKGSARLPIAVANNVRKGLEPFFKMYKVDKK